MVTWSEDTGSIHVYDLTAQKGTTISSSSSSHPAIYGNKIVWHDESSGTPRLTVYDIPSGARSYITQNVDSTSIPKIYGSRIVWGSNGNVYLRDISTSTQTQIAVGISPDIYDTKVVFSSGYIYMYDITTEKTETIYSDYDELENPHIYGNKVIWSNPYTFMGFIQMYDLVTKNTISVTSDVAWLDNQQMGDDTGTHTAIYDDKIVYAKISNDQFGNAGVYVYNISTGQSSQVINYPVEVYTTPDIYDNMVVWGSETNGNEIYVCNLKTSATTQLPVANFTCNVTSGRVPLSIAFTDTSIGTPTSRSWDFGDGTNSTQQNPMHIYSAIGNYLVNLTVSDYNSTYSKSVLITVLKSVPLVANFSTSVTKGYAPLDVQFKDLSENAQFWYWDFGDGTFDSVYSTQQNPMHTYLKAGNYTVTLAASDYNSTDYKSATITVSEQPVHILPIADFNSDPTSGYAPLTVQFTDLSQNATGWNWDFGDGVTSTEQSPTHIYYAEGTYNANLTVSNVHGTVNKTAIINVQSQSSSDGGSSDVSDGGSSHSSGGSGGGAGGSPEPQSNVEKKELSQTFISSGTSARFDFPQKVTPVVNVSFDSKKTAGKTTTIIEMLKGKSILVSGLPSNEVYKFLNIWVGNSGFATSKNIENAIVYFKVEKSWVQDKKIDKSSITLNRYSDKAWNRLPTSLSSEDDNYLYLTAQTPGFSPFAITGKTTALENIQPSADKTKPAVNVTQNNTNTGSAATTAANTEQTPGKTQGSNASGKQSTKAPGFEIASGIICLLCVFLYRKR
jgi:PGF-pre-PGF domain-containing protein